MRTEFRETYNKLNAQWWTRGKGADMGPTKKIAQMLNISNSEAAEYCQQVRSASGYGHNLQYKIIANVLMNYSTRSVN